MLLQDQDAPAPADPYNPDILRDTEADFDLVAYIGAHPISFAVIVIVLLIFVGWYVHRRRRKM